MSLETYKGNVLLIVNVASKNVVILLKRRPTRKYMRNVNDDGNWLYGFGFPANKFQRAGPGTEEELKSSAY